MNAQIQQSRIKSSGWALLTAAALLGSSPAWAQVDNYQFTPSQGTYIPLQGGTPVTNIQSDDALSGSIPLGFSFNFDGTPFTTCLVSSNGWLTFNSGNTSNNLTNNLATGPAAGRPLVAPFWDDLNGTGGTASYATTGTTGNHVFTFEWLNWYRYGNTGGPSFSMQVQLFEGTNVVRFVYRQESATNTNTLASIGLSGVGTGSGSFLSLSDAVANPSVSSTTENDQISVRPPTGQVYQFTPPVPSACPTPRNLTASVSGIQAALTWTVVGGGGTFSVIYGPTGFDPTTGGTTIPGITGSGTVITNLVPGSYQFYVQQNCGTATGNSNLSSAGGFSVDCPTPTGLTVGATTNTTAVLTWASPVTTGATFTVIYGLSGFDPAVGGNRITGITTLGTTLTNLAPATDYEFYVQQICLGGGTGTIAGPVSIATPLTAPDNDEACGAIALTGSNITVTNSGATTSQQAGIQLPACSPAQAPSDVWFTMIPSGTSTVLNITGTAAGLVRVFTTPDCSAGPFTQVACQAAATNNAGFTAPLTFSGLTAGQRYYVAISGYGSSDAAGSFAISGTALASRAQAETNALVVYPNPSNTGQLTLRLASAHAAGQLTLLNGMGQTVFAKALPAGTTEYSLNTRTVAAGVYTLRVQAGTDLLTRKVVIE
jgi:hypothetical protein